MEPWDRGGGVGFHGWMDISFGCVELTTWVELIFFVDICWPRVIFF